MHYQLCQIDKQLPAPNFVFNLLPQTEFILPLLLIAHLPKGVDHNKSKLDEASMFLLLFLKKKGKKKKKK